MAHFRKNIITIFVNDFCNMGCIYCPTHGLMSNKKLKISKNHVIDLNFAKKGIDDFFLSSNSKRIRFFGAGEPTLAFKRMVEIKDYAFNLAGNDLFVELQSSGYFNNNISKWISENIDMLWISLDGIQDIQNMQRPILPNKPSFNIVDRNIKEINKSFKTVIGLRPTITKFNVDRQKELIDYAKFNKIKIIYAYPWAAYTKKTNGSPDLQYFADKFLEAREYAKRLGIYYSTTFIVNFDEEVEISCRALIPVPHLTPDGYVSCCDAVNCSSGLLPELIYGKYNKINRTINYFSDRIENIRERNIYNLIKCRDCPIIKHCAGGCVASAMLVSNDFMGINPEYCKVTKYLAQKIPEMINVGYDPNIPLHP